MKNGLERPDPEGLILTRVSTSRVDTKDFPVVLLFGVRGFFRSCCGVRSCVPLDSLSLTVFELTNYLVLLLLV